MRILIPLVVIASAFAGLPPILVLAYGIYNSIGEIELIGLFNLWTGGSLLVSAACLWGYAAAYIFCRRSFILRSLSTLRSRHIIVGLVSGIVGGIMLEHMWSPNPVIYIPWGFFVWPVIALVIVGLLGPMWPNPRVQPTPASGRG